MWKGFSGFNFEFNKLHKTPLISQPIYVFNKHFEENLLKKINRKLLCLTWLSESAHHFSFLQTGSFEIPNEP